MNIKEIKEKKQKAEKEILAILENFMLETKCKVENINYCMGEIHDDEGKLFTTNYEFSLDVRI